MFRVIPGDPVDKMLPCSEAVDSSLLFRLRVIEPEKRGNNRHEQRRSEVWGLRVLALE